MGKKTDDKSEHIKMKEKKRSSKENSWQYKPPKCQCRPIYSKTGFHTDRERIANLEVEIRNMAYKFEHSFSKE